MFNRIVATIEARMTSNRLPGKVLLDLGGVTVLEFMIKRIRKSRLVDEIVVATTVNDADNLIVDLCERIDCKYFRGSENDVLLRVLCAAKSLCADIIVELTGDCPFIDPDIVDTVINGYLSGNYNYCSNTIERSFPDGFDVEVFSVKDLEKVSELTNDPIDRVHVSSFFYRNPEKFKLFNIKADKDLFWPELGVTLDEKKDYDLLVSLFKEMDKNITEFRALDVVTCLKEKPELLEINKSVRRKELNEG